MENVNRRTFLKAAGMTALPVSAHARSIGNSSGPAKASSLKFEKKYRLIYNDDGGSSSVLEPPLSPEQWVAATLGQIAGTRVEALSWPVGVNGSYVMHYPTRIPEGEVAGDSLRPETGVKLESAWWWRYVKCIRSLIEQGHDPMKLMIDGAHQAGIDVWIHIRQNDWHHVRGESTADPKHFLNFMAGRFWRDHPEWRIGRAGLEGWPEGVQVSEAAIDFQDFAQEPVRQYRIDIVQEVASRFNVDGIELDFMRCPYFFKKSQVPQMTPVMTGYIRQIRQLLNRLGKERGRPIGLSARVPWTIQGALSIGLDAEAWVRQELLDQLVPSPFFGMTLDADVSEWIALGRRYGCRIYPCIEESYKAGIAVEGGVPGLQWVDLERARATALNFWNAGADGVYLFNWPDRGRNINTHPGLTELHDASVLQRKNKRYVVGRKSERAAWPFCELPRTIPARLTRNEPVNLTLPVSDDLLGNRDQVDTVRLCLLLENLTSFDRLEVVLNGEKVGELMNPIRPGQHVPHATVGSLMTWQYYNLKGHPPKRGRNEIQVRLLERNKDFEQPWADCPLVLSDVELEIKYRWPWTDWKPPTKGAFL